MSLTKSQILIYYRGWFDLEFSSSMGKNSASAAVQASTRTVWPKNHRQVFEYHLCPSVRSYTPDTPKPTFQRLIHPVPVLHIWGETLPCKRDGIVEIPPANTCSYPGEYKGLFHRKKRRPRQTHRIRAFQLHWIFDIPSGCLHIVLVCLRQFSTMAKHPFALCELFLALC